MFICWSISGVGFVFYANLVVKSSTLVIIGVVLGSIISFGSIILKLTKSFPTLAHSTLLAYLLWMSVFSIYTWGIDSEGMFWMSVLPICGGFFAGVRGAIIWTFLPVLTVLVFYNFPLTVDDLERAGEATPFLVLSTNIGVTIVVGLISSLFMHNEQMYEQDLIREKKHSDSLIQIVSHDVNNQLTILGISLYGIKKSVEADNRYLKKLEVALSKTQEIIESVSQLQALKEGKVSVKTEEIKSSEIVHHCKNTFEDIAEAKGVTLSFGVKSELRFIADKSVLFHQVLSNLLSNAIKFSNKGDTIDITIEEEGRVISIKVNDQGIGIPKELISKLFDENAKTNRAGTSGEAGTGFGLPLAKTFVEVMDGTLEVESKTKEDGFARPGTTFTVKLKKLG